MAAFLKLSHELDARPRERELNATAVGWILVPVDISGSDEAIGEDARGG